MKTLRARFWKALAAYGAIGAAAFFTLDEHYRWIVLILLAALVLKSWVALKRTELE